MPGQSVVILGGVGGGIVVAQAIAAAAAAGDDITLAGFLNDVEPVGFQFAGAPVLGPFAQWADCDARAHFISAIQKPKRAFARLERVASLGIPDARWTNIIHPMACIAERVTMGRGCYVGPFAVIEPETVGGSHLCLRGGCYVSHDVRMGDYVFVGPNATVLSHCQIGTGVHVGAGAVCREEITIGRYALVGAGAVVVRDVSEFSIVAGNPARAIGRVNDAAASHRG